MSRPVSGFMPFAANPVESTRFNAGSNIFGKKLSTTDETSDALPAIMNENSSADHGVNSSFASTEPTEVWTDQELFAYLDEQLATPTVSRLEQELRGSTVLRSRLTELISLRNQGEHSVGEIWREHRLSCPDRSVLRRYLLGMLDAEMGEYIRFHAEVVGCRFCTANLGDLSSAAEAAPEQELRRQRYFESSAGELPPTT